MKFEVGEIAVVRQAFDQRLVGIEVEIVAFAGCARGEFRYQVDSPLLQAIVQEMCHVDGYTIIAKCFSQESNLRKRKEPPKQDWIRLCDFRPIELETA